MKSVRPSINRNALRITAKFWKQFSKTRRFGPRALMKRNWRRLPHGSPRTFFSAAPAEGKDSLLQRLFRAIRVRDRFQLAWLYVHGNDIDIAVVDGAPLRTETGKRREHLERLRDAMLLAKVTVFAALHVRSRIDKVEDRFGAKLLSQRSAGAVSVRRGICSCADRWGQA
jgi:hypothetical protein